MRWFSQVVENMGKEEGKEDNPEVYHLCNTCCENLNANA
jgi:hypothetical protein